MDFKSSDNNIIELDRKNELPKENYTKELSASASTEELVLKTLNQLQFVKAQSRGRTFIRDENKIRNFDINRLPLVDVARYLKIGVFKSLIPLLGQYDPEYRIIHLRSDDAHTFVHELVHAIDFILPNQNTRSFYMELVAEFSTAVLCKIYSIPNNISDSKYYLERYYTSEIDTINNINIINRVIDIVDFVRRCKKAIGVNDTREKANAI
jgi:hypothetical protein